MNYFTSFNREEKNEKRQGTKREEKKAKQGGGFKAKRTQGESK